MSGTVEKVHLDEIELSDQTFRISSNDSEIETINVRLSPLAESINSIGLINMPVLKRRADRYIVVCGFRRVHAMRLAGVAETSALIVSYDDNICARLAISDNAFQRPLNVMEQVRGVHLLRRSLSCEEIASTSSAIFNSNMNVAMVKMLEDLSQMDPSVHQLIENDRIAMGPALKLKGYNIEAINSFITLFSKIRTGLNKQKEIITHIHEIAARDQISISEIINSDDINQIIDHSDNDMDENRKGNLVRALLFQRRYPNLAKAKERFAINSKLLNLKGGIRLDPPVDFEGRDYTFTFKFSTVEELAEKVEILLKVSQNHLIGQMI